MIIKKNNFNLAGRKYRGNWPFSVDQVAVLRMKVEEYDCYGIIHNFGAFALSGVLESYSFAKLEDAGIWADADQKFSDSAFDEGIIRTKKSLTPFFEYIEEVLK